MADTALSGYMKSNRDRRLDEFPVATSGGSTAGFMQRVIRGESAAMVVLGDSTGVIGASPWPLCVSGGSLRSSPRTAWSSALGTTPRRAHVAVGAATSNPTDLWPGTSSQTVQTGTGSSPIRIWNGSVSGSPVTYLWPT